VENKMFVRVLAVVSLVFVFTPSAALSQPMTLELLKKRCADKTIVMGHDARGRVIKTGERLGGFCAGFLQGALAAMQEANIACPERETDARFLLSVLETYVKDAGISQADAGQVVDEAFRRAFPCNK
jgi:hypothetical protein